MISKLYAVFFISLTAFFISCSGSNNEDYIDKSLVSPPGENKIIKSADTALPAVQPIIAQPNTPVITHATTPVTIGSNAVPVTSNPVSQATGAGMNPPHGQPGHRCDIAVGAPLNSKPVQTTAPSASISTTPVAPATANTQTTAPGINPPHGQPGHRCDIAVGDPLNSKPVQNATITQPTVTPINLTAPKPDSSQNQ